MDDKHEVYKAQDKLAGDDDTWAKFCKWEEGGVHFAGGARVPDEGHYGNNEGEYGPGKPDPRESKENPDIPEYGRFGLLCFLFMKMSRSGGESGLVCEMYLGPAGCMIHAVHVVKVHDVYNSK